MNFSTQLKQLHITLMISCLIIRKDYNALSPPSPDSAGSDCEQSETD